jgi:hypothetical protein
MAPTSPRDDRADDLGGHAGLRGLVHAELGAGAAVLGEHPGDPGREPGVAGDPLAIVRHPDHLPEGHQGRRVGVEEVSGIADVVGIRPLEGVELPLQEPLEHRDRSFRGPLDH